MSLCSNRPPRFSVVTNASRLDGEVADVLRRYEVSVVGSIDGPREVNDCQRVDTNGRGTFEEVDENLRSYRSRAPLSIEATYTSNHVKHGISRSSLKQWLSNRYETSRVEIVDVSHDRGGADPNLDVDSDSFEEALDAFFGSHDHPCSDFIYEMARTLVLGKGSSYFCSAGVDKFSVAMNGDIYPCHLLVGDSRYVLGSVTHGNGTFSFEALTKDREDCLSCPYKLFCRTCAFHLIRNDSHCEEMKRHISRFLSGMMHLLLSDRDEYERALERCARYGQENDIRSLRE